MASKSKSKGSPKKAPKAVKSPSAPANKSKVKPLAKAAKAPAKPVRKAAKPAPKAPAKSAKAAKSAKPVKAAPKKAQKSSGPAKSVAKAPKNGTSIHSTKALKPHSAKLPVKKTASKTSPKASGPAKASVPSKKSPPAKNSAKSKTVTSPKETKKAPANRPAAGAKPVTTHPKALVKSISQVKAAPVPAKASKEAASSKALVANEKDSRKSKPDLFKGPFFQEVPVGSPAVRKSRVAQVPVVALRKPKGEESHDELIARIEKELLTVRMAGKKVHREQVCTKCCINPVDPGFMVDRDTGYCVECALVLGLGHTREARQQNFHPSLMKSEDEAIAE